jgi:hypothetical protein
VLTVGSVTSGTVAVGQPVAGAGVLPLTAIEGNLSGSGAGSTWLVNNAQAVAAESMTMSATPLAVSYNSIDGATANRGFFDVQPDGNFGFDRNLGSLSYMGGTAAAALGLTRASGALDSTPSEDQTSAAALMSYLVQHESSQFGSFQATWSELAQADPQYLDGLAAWAQSTDGLYTFLSQTSTTPPAGSSAPTTDPAGTYSGAGASAPTPAAPGTYIPGAGATSVAAEITDPAGTYSLAGASAPTLAQPGYYVPTMGASSETLDSPHYYTPYAGATTEFLAQAPTISGTAARQTIAALETDTPFASVEPRGVSVTTITDPNIDTIDSLSIQLTGGGGTLSDGAGFNGLMMSASGVYTLSGTAAAITGELDALVFTPNTFDATTTFTLTDTTSLGTSASDAHTTVTVTGGEPVYSVSYFLANQTTLDGTPGGFDILDTAGAITANLDQLNDSNIDAIAISDNGNVGVSVQQLTTGAMAIHRLQNANLSPVLLAITDTAADIENELSTLVAKTGAGEIASITASDGPISPVSAATFLADQSTLGKIVGGFAISDTATNVVTDLDQLDDPNISAITISDNGEISASVAQLTADAMAIGDLKNANASPVLLAINDTAGDVQTGLSTLVQDTGEIRSITTSNGPIVVSAATFLADQPTLDKIAGGVDGFDVSDDAANLVADLPTINADSGVDAVTVDIGDATLSGGGGVNAPNFSESGWGTSLTLDENLDYAGLFSEDAGATFMLSRGDLLLSGAANLAGGTVGGSNTLDTEGTTTVSGLTIGGTVEWENTGTVNESGGSATIGDLSGDRAILDNTSTGTYDITDDSGIDRGSSTASHIENAGLIEKTGGTGVSTIVPNVTNNRMIEVVSGTLAFNGRIMGTGSDTISGAATLQFNAEVLAGQTLSFAGSGGELALRDPAGFAGDISGFDAIGAGSNDTIEVAGPWIFSGFTENPGGKEGTLGFMNGANTLSLTLLGDYTPADFVHKAGPNGSTLITYTKTGVDSLLRPVSGAETHAGEFDMANAGSERGDWGAGPSWDGPIGHAPGYST